jgi:hypothetical protein
MRFIPTKNIIDYRDTGRAVFEKKCKYCDNSFYPIREDAKFCSASCRTRSAREAIKAPKVGMVNQVVPVKSVEAVKPPVKPVETIKPPVRPVEALKPLVKPVETIKPPVRPVEVVKPPFKPKPTTISPEELAAKKRKELENLAFQEYVRKNRAEKIKELEDSIPYPLGIPKGSWQERSRRIGHYVDNDLSMDQKELINFINGGL